MTASYLYLLGTDALPADAIHNQRRIEEVVNYSLLFTFTPHASLLLPNPTECR
jgi:hypothetical protein